VLLRLGKLNRMPFFKKIRTLLQLPLAFLQVFWVFFRFRPHAVLGVGGASSGPVLLAAVILKRLRLFSGTIGLFEQNAVLGFTNRHLVRFMDLIFCGFALPELKLPFTVIGNPVWHLPLPKKKPTDQFVIFVFGGSQGAVGLNSLIINLQKSLREETSLFWLHQTGEKDLPRVLEANMPRTELFSFIEDMRPFYQKADLVIARAGALSIAEIAAQGKACILVPLPTAADNHQLKNAQILLEKKACVLFEQHQPVEHLMQWVLKLKNDPEEKRFLEEKIKDFFVLDSSQICCEKMYASLKKK
jgi:UDP-N-acetylglucosamine--N-acetylmuramyl-(pentapeptide) pyrophosphoryl-undecaprenol N-acetylglucosamine transferase